jgi:hypothetical protein
MRREYQGRRSINVKKPKKLAGKVIQTIKIGKRWRFGYVSYINRLYQGTL